MEIYKNDFFVAQLFVSKKLIEVNWLSAISLMTDEQYKECFMVMTSLIKIFKPYKVFVDASTMNFYAHHKLQQWENQINTQHTIAIDLKKIAIVISANAVGQDRAEQTVKEIKNPTFSTHYFNCIVEAKTWMEVDNL